MAEVWSELLHAHERVHGGHEPGVAEHRPRAAVLCCSDARVPPSVVFDQPAGALFVVRVAGNTAGPSALASLDYAVEQLGVDLVVVLGHTECGAVAAAVAGQCGGELAAITDPICELVRSAPGADPVDLVHRNVEQTMTVLADHAGAVGRAVRDGRVTVVGAVHDLASGRLRPVDDQRSQPTNPLLESS